MQKKMCQTLGAGSGLYCGYIKTPLLVRNVTLTTSINLELFDKISIDTVIKRKNNGLFFLNLLPVINKIY